MYADSVIRRRLRDLRPQVEARLRQQNSLTEEQSFQFVRHRIDEVVRANTHLNLLLTDEGTTQRPYRTPEVIWIENERAICQADFRYWATRYAFIKDRSGRIVRFLPEIAQQIILDVWSDLEAAGKAIEIVQLKARQLGVTTLVELAIAHRVQFYHNVNAVVGSFAPDESRRMSAKMELCWDHQPYWLMPALTKRVSGEVFEFGAMNSAVSIQHGSQMSGIARGDTVNIYHLSEIPDFVNPRSLIEDSLLRAVHPNPWTLGVLESNARVRNDWWHKLWKRASTRWPRGRSRLCPVFLPWFVGRDQYPTPTWLKTLPIPRDWEPALLTRKHAARAESYVKTSELLSKYLGETWSMSPEQQWFWEASREEYAESGNLSGWYREMPADDIEAFQAMGQSVFSADLLAEFRESARIPYVFGIIGQEHEIHARLQPDRGEVDDRMPPIPIEAGWADAQPPFRYTLLPLKRPRHSGIDPLGRLLIWEFPEEEHDYALGVDPSEGVGRDRSAIMVIRKGDLERPDALVAEFASPWLSSADLWPFLLAIGTLYSPRVAGVLRQARQVIEVRTGGGNMAQHDLRKRGWSNFHRWLHLDRRRLNVDSANLIGWVTNHRTRKAMLDYFVKSVRDGNLEIFSSWFVEEMGHLEAYAMHDESSARLQAIRGQHDDRIMAVAMALFSLHIMEIQGSAPSLATRRAETQRATARFYPAYSPGLQGQDQTGWLPERGTPELIERVVD